MTDAIDLSWLTDLQRDVDRHADKARMHERRVADVQTTVDNFTVALNAAKDKQAAAVTTLSEAASKRKAAAEKYEKAKAGVRAILADVDVSTSDG
jgi:hypothetical protein